MEENLDLYAYLDTKHAVLIDFDQYNDIMTKKYYMILMKENYKYLNDSQILRGYHDALKDIKERYNIDLSERCR